jgi:C-terminal processing protease CtpA/Prc
MRTICALLLTALVGAGWASAQASVEQPLLREPSISWTQVVFSSRGHVWIAPRSGGMARRLTKGDYAEHSAVFSPDGEMIAFTRVGSVYVVPATGGEPRRLTWHPAESTVTGWTPDGRYVLYHSNRDRPLPSMPRLFRVPAEGGMEEPLPMAVSGFASYSPDGTRIALSPVPEISIYTGRDRYRGGSTSFLAIYEPAARRYEELTHSQYNDTYPMWRGNSIYFASDRSGIMNLYRYDLASRVTDALTTYHDFNVREPSLGPDAIVFQTAGRLHTYDLSTAQTTDLKIALPAVTTSDEQRGLWARVFDGAWKTYRDHAAFPVSEWKVIRTRYEPLVSAAADRTDLQFVITEMLAETGQSHMLLRMPPHPQALSEISTAGLLGADFTIENGLYRFARIYKGPESPLSDVLAGDYLIAVDDRPLHSPDDLFAAFDGAAGKPMRIMVNAQPSEAGARTITVKPIQDDQPLRYRAWVEERYRRVREAGAGRIAYIHIPEILPAGAESFRKQFESQNDAEALILDVRNNNGGTMTDFFLDFLTRGKERVMFHRAPDIRVSFPEFALPGPKVILANEQSVSGAEELVYLAQRRKLVTFVGAQTSGSLIGNGTEYHLDDGSIMMVPEWPVYTIEDGKWYPEGKGVVPDYAVEQRLDLVIDGKDPQLEKAIVIVMEKLGSVPRSPQTPPSGN